MPAKKFVYLILVLLIASLTGFAQKPAAGLRQEQPPIPPEEIIRKLAEKEKLFRIARGNYTYRQDVKVQELNANDRVLGEYRMVSDIVFDPSGKRTERIVYAPADTLKGFSLSPEDIQDLREIQPFVLTSDDIVKYKLNYLGKELIDEIDCFAFDVEPKVLEKGQRYFQGRIWVDDKDLQIVKTYGKAVPDVRKGDNENLFPRFETYREQIDQYWFPTYTRANDTLQFSSGAKRMRMIVKYENYKKFEADVKLTFGDAVDGGALDKAPTTDKKAPALDPKLNESKKKK
ncbi:MAG TPA: hypothetical protein VE422_34135 [Terriglobia bacterium]|nr:hypothetical protein [Terriglobia bacterium]